MLTAFISGRPLCWLCLVRLTILGLPGFSCEVLFGDRRAEHYRAAPLRAQGASARGLPGKVRAGFGPVAVSTDNFGFGDVLNF